MESKIFGVFALSILVLVLFMSLGSAAITLTATSPAILTKTQTSTSFNVSANDLVNFTSPSTTVIIEDSDSNVISLTITNTSELIGVNFATFSATFIGSISEDFNLGTYSTTLIIEAVNATNVSDTDTIVVTLSFENSEVCEYNNLGNNLKIEIEDINVEGFGKDEEWFPLDEIEIEVEVENDGQEDIDDIVIEWGLYNSETGDWVIDDEENDFNLKDGDKETVMITFKLDDIDEFEDNGEYVFYVWATGEDDDFERNDSCVSTSESIEIVIEDDFVVLDNIQIPDTVQCGEDVQILADVWNIGEDDQDDVYVLVYNKALGINEEIIMGDIDAFEDANTPFKFNFRVPSDAEEKIHNIKFTVYDEDNDIYENSEDDKAVFNVLIKVEGNCIAEAAPVSVSTTIESGGKAGEELIVKVSIKNIGDEAATYTLNVAGYAEWADSAKLSPSDELTLVAGESANVLITFDVNEDAVGKESLFDIVFSGDASVTQHVSPGILIEKSGWSITGWNIRENPYIWGIGLFNIILIVVIVIVAIRLARK